VKAVGTKDEGKPVVGQASSDIPALKSYWGKPAVRNFRGGNGNVGILRSPVRAIALPDHEKGAAISGAKRTPKTACTVSQRSSRSCPWASRIYVSADLEGIAL
jgi:hypothetical protein